jgi:hypothetical protein
MDGLVLLPQHGCEVGAQLTRPCAQPGDPGTQVQHQALAGEAAAHVRLEVGRQLDGRVLAEHGVHAT